MQKRLDDETLLGFILTGVPQSQIAKNYGLTTSAICRRIHQPEFQEKLSEHRKAVIDNIMTKLTEASVEAVEVLSSLMRDKNHYLRFSSASRILSLLMDFSVEQDLIKQIEELKRNQNSTISERGCG